MEFNSPEMYLNICGLCGKSFVKSQQVVCSLPEDWLLANDLSGSQSILNKNSYFSAFSLSLNLYFHSASTCIFTQSFPLFSLAEHWLLANNLSAPQSILNKLQLSLRQKKLNNIYHTFSIRHNPGAFWRSLILVNILDFQRHFISLYRIDFLVNV